jgi:hypothetical protein
LLLAGSGLGMMASQLGAVTVSSVPDEKSAEVGGLQNTGTQLGASIGTALAGAVLISALTASFFTGIQNNPNIPHSVVSQAQTQLAGGVPFMSKADAEAALKEANVSRLSNPAPRPSPDHPPAWARRISRRTTGWPRYECLGGRAARPIPPAMPARSGPCDSLRTGRGSSACDSWTQPRLGRNEPFWHRHA